MRGDLSSVHVFVWFVRGQTVIRPTQAIPGVTTLPKHKHSSKDPNKHGNPLRF
jgi:hypothetical protein